MNALDLLSNLTRQGVKVSLSDDQLKLDAPKGVLTPDLLSALRQHKPAILAALSGADPQQTAEAVHEHVEERAAIMEFDGGLPRPEAECRAGATIRVFEYRLSDSPFRWLVMIAPGCDLAEAERTLRDRFLDRFVEVRPYAWRSR